jgi:hypothetical protein
MAVPLNRMPLAGSALATPSAPCLGPLPPLEQLDVVLRMRRPARADDVTAVVRFVLDQDLSVLDVDHRAGTVDVRGSVLGLTRAFGVQMRSYRGPDGPFRARRGVVLVPVTLAGVIVAVDGLDERPPHAVSSRIPPARRRAWPRACRRAPARPAPPSPFSSLSVSAAPRVRAGQVCAEHEGETGRTVPPSVAGVDHDDVVVVPGGCDGGAAPARLAVVLHLPVRPTPAPLDHDADLHGDDHDRGPDGPRTVPLAPARARRRGPLVRAAAEQQHRRLARQLHPAMVDRS